MLATSIIRCLRSRSCSSYRSLKAVAARSQQAQISKWGRRSWSNTSQCYSALTVSMTEDEVEITNGEEKLSFLQFWLRDNCKCKDCCHPLTKQRQVDTFQIPSGIRAKHASINGKNLLLEWPDGHTSNFDVDWLRRNGYGMKYPIFDVGNVNKIYWNSDIANNLPEDIDFNKALNTKEGLASLYKRIIQYGFAFVQNTPLDNEAFQNLLFRVATGKQTIYGNFFEFTSNNVEHLDTAYLSIALGGHTDGTYFFESPGLQVFHCKYHDGEGGENLFVDGIHAALQLKEKYPDAFQFLSTTSIPAVYYEDKYIFKNCAPMIRIDPATGEIYHVRVNNDDRDTFNTSDATSMKRFYKYLKQYYSLLRAPENSFWIKLTPGRSIIVDNWRVLHGRAAFTGTRTVAGCYLLKDDFLARARFYLEDY